MCPKRNLHEDLPLGSTPPRPSNVTSSFHIEEVDICDGEVKLVRTKTSNKVWQMRVWVRGEKRYFRKSLREKDLEIAKEKAKQIYYEMMGKIQIGRKIFTPSASEIVELYLQYQQTRADNGWITQGRHKTIATQLKHFIRFLGEDTKMGDIQRKKYRDYYNFRRKNNPEVKDTTLINERSTSPGANAGAAFHPYHPFPKSTHTLRSWARLM